MVVVVVNDQLFNLDNKQDKPRGTTRTFNKNSNVTQIE